MQIKTPAKINLYLNVGGKRADGFHDILSIMEKVGLYDEIEITGSDNISVSGPAFFRSWTAKSEIGIYGGIGRGFLSMIGAIASVTITASGAGFRTEMCSILTE